MQLDMMKQINRIFFFSVMMFLFGSGFTAAQELETVVPARDFPDEYIQVTYDRAHNIVKDLELESGKTERITKIVAQQYRDLSAIQDTRKDQLEMIEQEFEDQDTIEQLIREIRIKTRLRENALHHQFIAKLAAEIAPRQVDQIKNGMTYNVVPVTYKGYLELLPELTGEQKNTIKAFLIEAREYAMDAGSSEQKHHIFNQYKGKINNYVSAEGYDLKEAEEQMRRKNQSESGSN